jgi:hypothetical protein
MPLLNIDPLIKLGVVEAILKRVFDPAPSRPTLIAWIEEGVLEGKQIGRGDNWFIYKSSLDDLICRTQPQQQRMAA